MEFKAGTPTTLLVRGWFKLCVQPMFQTPPSCSILVSSLNHYKKPSLDQQWSMSTLLSHCQPSCSEITISATKKEVHDKNQLSTSQGLLPNATFNNCSINITINQPGPTTQQVVTPPTSHPPPKRPQVMYDWPETTRITILFFRLAVLSNNVK